MFLGRIDAVTRLEDYPINAHHNFLKRSAVKIGEGRVVGDVGQFDARRRLEQGTKGMQVRDMKRPSGK